MGGKEEGKEKEGKKTFQIGLGKGIHWLTQLKSLQGKSGFRHSQIPQVNHVINNWFFSVSHLCFPVPWLHSHAGPALIVAKLLLKAPGLHPHNSKSSINNNECFPFKKSRFASQQALIWPRRAGVLIGQAWVKCLSLEGINTTKPYELRVGKRWFPQGKSGCYCQGEKKIEKKEERRAGGRVWEREIELEKERCKIKPQTSTVPFWRFYFHTHFFPHIFNFKMSLTQVLTSSP